MKKFLSVFIPVLVVIAIFALVAWYVETHISPDFAMGSTVLVRFVFVGVGLLLVLNVYAFTRDHPMWEVGTRQIVYMAIGAALYAIFSWLFNGSVFVVPSVSQVALRPAIVIPMFFGFQFGPVVGFFTGAVGNMFGDALTGFGLSPQWSIGNGIVGLVAGLSWLAKDKGKSVDTILVIAADLVALVFGLYLLNPTIQNKLFFNAPAGIFGDQNITLLAALSIIIGFILVLIVRFAFRKNLTLAAAVTWAMLGNFIGIGFASLSDIFINGYSPAVAIVGEFLPAAGPNLIFAAILVPIFVVAYNAIEKQTGR